MLRLRLAVDYSAREAIVAAARRAAVRPTIWQGESRIDQDVFAGLLGDAVHESEPVRDLGEALSKALLGAVRDGGSRFQRSWGR